MKNESLEKNGTGFAHQTSVSLNAQSIGFLRIGRLHMFLFIPLVIKIEGNQIKVGIASPGQAEFSPAPVNAGQPQRGRMPEMPQTQEPAKPSIREMLVRPSLN